MITLGGAIITGFWRVHLVCGPYISHPWTKDTIQFPEQSPFNSFSWHKTVHGPNPQDMDGDNPDFLWDKES